MSRINLITDRAGELIPAARIPLSAAELGPSPAGAVLSVASNVLESIGKARRIRQLQDLDNRAEAGVTEAFHQASVALENEFAEYDRRTQSLREQPEFADLQDASLRREAQRMLDARIAMGRARLIPVVAGKEKERFGDAFDLFVRRTVEAVQQRSMDAGDAAEAVRSRLEPAIGTFLTAEQASAIMLDVQETLDGVRKDAVRGSLVEDFRTLTGQWASADNDRDRERIEVAWGELVDQAVEDQAIDQERAAELRESFKPAGLGQVDREIASLVSRGNDAAALGDLDMLDELQTRLEELPDTLDRRSAMSHFRRLEAGGLESGATIAAIQSGLRLPHTTRVQSTVDAMAQGMILARPDAPFADLARDLVDQFGPTTVMPSMVTSFVTGAAGNPQATPADQIASAVDLLTYMRRNYLAAYEQSVDSDVRKWHAWMERLRLPGSDMKELAAAAQEAFNPKEPGRAAMVQGAQEDLRNFALGRFVERLRDDPQMKVDLEGDFTFTRLLGVETEIPGISLDVLGDLIPAEILDGYLAHFTVAMQNGASKDAAESIAWTNLVESGMGTTRVFRDRPRVQFNSPERLYAYPTELIESDLANAIGVDDFDGRVLWPEQMERDGFAWPRPKILEEKVGVGRFVGERTQKRRSLPDMIDFAREHMELVPVNERRGGMFFQAPDGRRLPVYWLHYRGTDGRLHPVLTEGGPDGVSPYLLAPWPTEGLSYRLRANENLRSVERARRIREQRERGGPEPVLPVRKEPAP